LASPKPIIPAHDEAETQSGQTARGQVEPAVPPWHPVALPPVIMVNTEEAIGAGTGSPGGFSPPRPPEASANEQTLGAVGNTPGYTENLPESSPRQSAPVPRPSAAKEIVGGVAIGLGIGALSTLIAVTILLLL